MIVFQFVKDFDRLRIPRTATQLSFNALFALIPLLALSLQILLWLPGSTFDSNDLLHWLLISGLPQGMDQWAADLEGWIEGVRQLSIAGLLISALSSMFLVMRLNEALSQIWETPVQPLKFFALWFSALALPIALSILLSLFAMAKTMFYWPDYFGTWFESLNQQVDLGRWVSILLLFIFLSLLYKFIPGKKIGRSKLLIVSFGTAIVISISGNLFMLVLSQLPSLQLMTGLISTLPLLLIWVFWVSILLLMGALFLKYWQSGPLKPLHILTWDQLVRIIETMHKNHETDWSFGQEIGLTHAEWDATLQTLVTLEWVSMLSKDCYRLTPHAYKQQFDQIWPLVSYQMPTEGDSLHRIFGPLAKMPLAKVLELMEQPEA